MTRNIDAMAFYGRDGIVQAYTHAKAFAGENGRIATLPDIIDARIATGVLRPVKVDSYDRSDGESEFRLEVDVTGTPWNMWLSTMSAEYYGLSKKGVPVIAVAHGVGPMSTLDGLMKAYAYEYKDKERNRHGGRISQDEFLQLIEHEDVTVVDAAHMLTLYRYPYSMLTEAECRKDPLLIARFGGQERLDRYLDVHARAAWEDWRSQRGDLVGTVLDNFDDRSHPDRQGENSPFIICSTDNNDLSYHRYRSGPHVAHETSIPEDGMAYAQLLTIQQIVNSSGGRQRERHITQSNLQCTVDLQGWRGGSRFVAMREGAVPGRFHEDIDFRNAIKNPVQRNALWQPSKKSHVGMTSLVEIGSELYSQLPQHGVDVETGVAVHAVRNIKPLGEAVWIELPADKERRSQSYSFFDVRPHAPEGANAYRVKKHKESWGKPPSMMVQFYEVELDLKRQLIDIEKFHRDYDLMMKVISLG